jgi:hypothetical protein
VRREKGRSNTTTITALTDGIMKSLDNFLRRGSNPRLGVENFPPAMAIYLANTKTSSRGKLGVDLLFRS